MLNTNLPLPVEPPILAASDAVIHAFDVECYPNYFLLGLLDVNSGAVEQYEISDRCNDGAALCARWPTLDVAVSFNGHAYDDHMIQRVLAGERDPCQLHKYSCALIGSRDHRFSPFYSSPRPIVIDLRAMIGDYASSLKEIGVKLDHPVLQELPYDPMLALAPEEMGDIVNYNINDLAVTRRLLRNQEAAIEARIGLFLNYGANVLSRPDSSIGEAILKELYDKIRPTETHWTAEVGSILSDLLSFEDPALIALHERMRQWQLEYSLEVEIAEDTQEEKKRLVKRDFTDTVTFRGTSYTVGLGGLHSHDEPAIFEANAACEILDIDAASFYPTVILEHAICPSHLDPHRFTPALRSIVERRLLAKATGDGHLASGLKVAVNSVFGKFASPYSWLCDPVMNATTTLNGQLMLLQLIECVTSVDGVEVLSANTDGILLNVPRPKSAEVRTLVDEIAALFRLTFEYKSFSRFVRRDIHNYMAIDCDGKVKAKGAYGYDQADMKRKATNRIVTDAVQNYFLRNVPVAETIRSCRDLTAFISYFKLTKEWMGRDSQGNDLGHIVRWYEAIGGTALTKVKVEKGIEKVVKFGLTERARVIANLPETFPDDIDYEHYIKLADALIEPIEHPEQRRLGTKALADLTEAEQAQLQSVRNSLTIDVTRCMAIDLAKYHADYAAKTKGNSYDTFKALLVRLWITQGGSLTKGDLRHLAGLLDSPEGNFVGRRKREMDKLVDWVCRDIVPFQRVPPIPEIAAEALTWATDTVTAFDKPSSLYHRSLLDSSLLKSEHVSAVLNGSSTLKRVAARVAARAVQHQYSLTADDLAAILTKLQDKLANITPTTKDISHAQS